jgi:hypothetical protein
MQLGKLLIIPIAFYGLKQLRELESVTKPPETAVTPLITTPTTTTQPGSVSPAGFLTGITELTGLFTPPTVTQLKRVADPFFSDKPLVREPVRERTGEVSVYRRPDFAVGPITGLAQSQQLDLTGFVPNVPVPTGPTFKQGGGVQL